MRLIDAEPIIRSLFEMKAQLGYDAITIDGMIKALGEADEVTDDQTPNPPLTLEELFEMDGEPVYCHSFLSGVGEWVICRVTDSNNNWFLELSGGEQEYGNLDTYGDKWLAYRRKPEESET